MYQNEPKFGNLFNRVEVFSVALKNLQISMPFQLVLRRTIYQGKMIK
jgi:hypothetical protein